MSNYVRDIEERGEWEKVEGSTFKRRKFNTLHRESHYLQRFSNNLLLYPVNGLAEENNTQGQ